MIFIAGAHYRNAGKTGTGVTQVQYLLPGAMYLNLKFFLRPGHVRRRRRRKEIRPVHTDHSGSHFDVTDTGACRHECKLSCHLASPLTLVSVIFLHHCCGRNHDKSWRTLTDIPTLKDHRHRTRTVLFVLFCYTTRQTHGGRIFLRIIYSLICY